MTNFTVNGLTDFYINYKYYTTTVGGAYLFGGDNITGTTPALRWFHRYSSLMMGNNTNLAVTIPDQAVTEVLAHIKTGTQSTVTYNDTTASATANYTTLTNVKNFTFFANNYGSGITRATAGDRIYKFKCYTDSAVLINLIPCRRKSDNVAGMYDTVSRTFLVNSSSDGAFVLGPDV